MSSPASSPSPPQIFRLPRIAYVLVLLLLFCTIPLAFTGQGVEGAPAVVGPQTLLLIIPIVGAVFIARTATFVDADAITVRLSFGSRRLTWDEIRGLTVNERSVYAVIREGSVRLPCVRITDLAAVAKASNGRLPAVAEPTPKFAPSRRRPRR